MSKYTIVHSASELHAGDHISWPTRMASGMFSHHAIVVAPKGGSEVKVIHVCSTGRRSEPASSGSCSLCGSGSPDSYVVKEEIIDLGQLMNDGQLRRYDHEPKDCNEPAEVIKNARSNIGKFDYDVWTNNCEHFARWCKTGNRESHQADSATQVALASASASASGVAFLST